MSHVRTQIRNAMMAALTGLPTTGPRVHASRPQTLPLPESELPALLISTGAETLENMRVAQAWPQLLSRVLSITVDAIAALSADIDDMLDTMVGEVESALNGSQTINNLSGLVPDGISLASLEIDLDGEGDVPVGRARMTWTGIYYTASNAPDIPK